MGGYSDLWKAIIRPPRANYSKKDLGPKRLMVFNAEGNTVKVQRTDFSIKNDRD